METTQAVDALASLAQSSRLEIYRHLVQAGSEGLAAGIIGERLGVPPATLSFHLAHLVRAGLARSRQEGRCVIYSANYDSMNALVGFLTDNCCQGASCGSVCKPARPTKGNDHEALPRARRRA
jgi:ArsR family transcriptional regulator, arsenate/arsenite/antimonite-responsive transcriptional repressor